LHAFLVDTQCWVKPPTTARALGRALCGEKPFQSNYDPLIGEYKDW
jgi:hypothetical protein